MTMRATSRERTRQLRGRHQSALRRGGASALSACAASLCAPAPSFVARVDTDPRNLSCYRFHRVWAPGVTRSGLSSSSGKFGIDHVVHQTGKRWGMWGDVKTVRRTRLGKGGAAHHMFPMSARAVNSVPMGAKHSTRPNDGTKQIILHTRGLILPSQRAL